VGGTIDVAADEEGALACDVLGRDGALAAARARNQGNFSS
jgi:hypothetical protein